MQKTIDHLNFITKHCKQTQAYLDGHSINQIQYFCVGMLERLEGTTFALKEILPKINDNPALDFSCGLILRSFLLDYLIIIKVAKIILDNESKQLAFEDAKEKVEAFCNECFSDGLPQTLSYIKAALEAKFLTLEQTAEIYNNMAKQYDLFFNTHVADGSEPVLKNKKKINGRELFLEIAKDSVISGLAMVYDVYTYYSKYDHFGIMYYDIIREEHNEKLIKISKSVELQVAAQSWLHFTLGMYSNNDPFLNAQFTSASDYFSTQIDK